MQRSAGARVADPWPAGKFNRTASQLIEMRSQAYLGLPHGPRAAATIDDAEIVET